MEQWRRVTLLVIGLVESVIFSGIVFGWANLLYILQEEGVYSYLCVNNVAEPGNLLNEQLIREDKYIVSQLASSLSLEAFENSTQDLELLEELENGKVTLKCAEQGNTFTLVYTVAATMYGLTSIFIGFSLDYFGLWTTRISGSVMTFTGFFCLAFTNKDKSWLLWPALNLIALGTNQLKLCSYQFINLWPSRRSTILFAYGAAFSISATVFTLLQYLYTSGISYRAITMPLAVLSVFTLPVTFLMPIMKVKEYVKPCPPRDIKGGGDAKTICNEEVRSLNSKERDCEVSSDMFLSVEANANLGLEASKEIEIPLSFSLLSASATFHVLWHFINFFMILFYSLSFNAWVYKSTKDSNQVAHYTQIMGICQLTGPLFTPLSGLFTDLRIKAAQKYPDPVKRLTLTIQAPAFSTAIATLCLTALMTCKMFVNKPAIYSSMALVAICRPLVHSSCVSYIRLRFPADHFNRLNGIFTTTVAVVMFVQYPIFIWMFSSDHNYAMAGKVLLLSLIVSLISPGHMMITKFAKRFALDQLRVCRPS